MGDNIGTIADPSAAGAAGPQTSLTPGGRRRGGRESIFDAIYEYQAGNTAVQQQRRISSIPLYQGQSGCSVGNTSCADWQIYQPFALHTADDVSGATIGGNTNNASNQVPSHAIAFRTTDITDPNSNPAPFAQQTSYGGGKLGIYSFWDTCDATGAPIMGINNPATAPNQYEFYNYSPHPAFSTTMPPNPSELGNQYFDANNTSGGHSAQGQNYQTDFFSASPAHGISVQNELYQLNTSSGDGNSAQQVAAAIQVAFQNYKLYLECTTSGLSLSNI